LTTKQANYETGADAFKTWYVDVRNRTPPTLYCVGTGEMRRLEVGPGLVTLLGGAPGDGKTTIAMQLVVDALRLNPTLKVCVCNVEMRPPMLLDRQLARLSGVDASLIRHRRLTSAHDRRIATAIKTLESLKDRLCFVRPPFDLGNVAATVDAFQADLLLMDYVQRVHHLGHQADTRGATNATMARLRQFADAGKAVIAIAAVGRTKDSTGRSCYQGLNLASFRESSELEYGADDAFILVPEEDDPGRVRLRQLKSRYGATRDLVLEFNKRLLRFADLRCDEVDEVDGEQVQSDLAVSRDGEPTTGSDNSEREGK
jgi:replicative DNA helicase